MNYFDIPHVDRVYLGELQTQCMFALRAFAYSDISFHQTNPDLDEFWYHIQMFLVSTANVHKMLHNSKKEKYKKHHKNLIKEYDLPNHKFKTENSIRNRFEHYDERIVDWIDSRENHNIAMSNAMPKNMIPDGTDVFKNYDHINRILSFDDLDVKIDDTYKKINQIDQRIQEILER